MSVGRNCHPHNSGLKATHRNFHKKRSDLSLPRYSQTHASLMLHKSQRGPHIEEPANVYSVCTSKWDRIKIDLRLSPRIITRTHTLTHICLRRVRKAGLTKHSLLRISISVVVRWCEEDVTETMKKLEHLHQHTDGSH